MCWDIYQLIDSAAVELTRWGSLRLAPIVYCTYVTSIIEKIAVDITSVGLAHNHELKLTSIS